MLGIDHYTVFLISGLLLNITPGSDTLYILGRSLSQGKAAGMMSVFGIITGALVHTVLAAFGLSLILMKSVLAFQLIKWVGAIYLIYMGIKAIKSNSSGDMTKQMERTANRKIYVQGFLTNLLNPKVALFYLAFLPQFVSVDNTYGALPFLILGLTFIVTGTLWCSLIVLGTELASSKLRSGSLAKYLNKFTGVIFIVLGIKLLRTVKPS
ncbi:LysE family translocator [Paenibacillus sp. SYP-B3998]|uniref:LysE family translocator n=1 Tax=Paenibacillus sp. SYP-B3998 TaxID=2678564 RepID=A0A6G3ZVX5_9BACL|nr:LysE family translocator [Paenibacillus sp. SYP-B3998]NEW06282.1 LysE family translocator [Paenibacillus sp. SYP-B3998]